jgi:pyruvate dehydrogenase E2 component (dihydrolipoamide acetyltransferase)
MPTLGEGVQQATLARWLKREGDRVAVGEELAEIETDKVTLSCEAEQEGYLECLVPEGATVEVGTTIARILDARNGTTMRQEEQPVEQASALPADESTQERSAAPGMSAAAAPAAVAMSRVRATPLARRIAQTAGIDLATVVGTGPSGLVTRVDLGDARNTRSADQLTRSMVASHVRQLTGLQRVVAERMAASRATVPEFEIQTEVTMDAVVALRERIKELAASVVPSINDFIIKAAALALRNHPLANGSFDDGSIVLHEHINVGVAVAADAALVVPVIAAADVRPLLEIAREARRLADRVRARSVTAAELGGGTFTVSNLGMYGMTAISPIINAPQAAILGVGAIRSVAVFDGPAVIERKLLTLTLSCDHRILYGAEAAAYLRDVRRLLEEPLRLLLDADLPNGK